MFKHFLTSDLRIASTVVLSLSSIFPFRNMIYSRNTVKMMTFDQYFIRSRRGGGEMTSENNPLKVTQSFQIFFFEKSTTDDSYLGRLL